jgi:hypothetical protein
VDGNILTDQQGKLLNIYRASMEEAIKTKQVRIFRNSTMSSVCYRYFITSPSQLRIFKEEREYGTNDGPNKAFHVYVDEDVDKSCKEYRSLFRLSRELDG